MNSLPQRKNIRLKNYDYSQTGYYFVTICTHNRQHLLSHIVGYGSHASPVGDGFYAIPKDVFHADPQRDGFNTIPHIELNLIGKEIVKTIEYINNNYPNVKSDKFVIMPNHIHFIIMLGQLQSGMCGKPDAQSGEHRNPDVDSYGHGNPPLHKVIGQLKSYTNKKYNYHNQKRNLILWQRNYYEHIIRNDNEYEKIYRYIETNPLKWLENK